MKANARISHFRIIKNDGQTNKKHVKAALKAVQAGEANPSDFPFLADTHHIRVNKLEVEPKGGVTIVSLEDSKDTAMAICGLREHFCRKVGRTIAMGRLNKALTAQH